MREPAIRCCAVPVLYANRDIYHIAGAQFLCRFAPFLIVTSTSHTNEDLSAAAFGVMNVPVVTAAGFKGHIVNTDLLRRKRCEIALSDKVFRKGVIGCADGKDHFILMFGFCVGGIVLRPYLLCHTEGRPRLGPARIKCRMGQDLRNFRFGHTVVLCSCQMVLKRRIRQSLRHQRHHCYNAAVSQRKLVFSAPHLAEQHIVIELGKLGGKQPQLISSCRHLFHCGASFTGGKGTIWGTLIGALLMAVIRNGLNLAGAKNDVQYIVIGSVIILAVTIDVFRNKMEAKARKMAAQ